MGLFNLFESNQEKAQKILDVITGENNSYMQLQNQYGKKINTGIYPIGNADGLVHHLLDCRKGLIAILGRCPQGILLKSGYKSFTSSQSIDFANDVIRKIKTDQRINW